MDEDTLQFENTLQPQQRPNRENAGQGISRLETMFTGKTYDVVEKKIQVKWTKRNMRQKRRTLLT